MPRRGKAPSAVTIRPASPGGACRPCLSPAFPLRGCAARLYSACSRKRAANHAGSRCPRPRAVVPLKEPCDAPFEVDSRLPCRGPFPRRRGLCQEYQVKFTRASKVGDKYRITIASTSKSSMKMTPEMPGMPSGTQEFAVDFAADVEVLAVDSSGQVTKEALKIARLARTAEGQTTQVLAAGDEVVAQVEGGEKSFTVKGAPASMEQAGTLMGLVQLATGGLTEDDMFAPSSAKKVGDSWPVNRAAIARSLAEDGNAVPEANITGTVKLLGVTKVGGVDCLDIQGDVKCTGLSATFPGLTAEKGEFAMTFSGKYPVDLALPALEGDQATSMSMAAKGQGEPGTPDMRVEMSGEETRKVKIEPAK